MRSCAAVYPRCNWIGRGQNVVARRAAGVSGRAQTFGAGLFIGAHATAEVARSRRCLDPISSADAALLRISSALLELARMYARKTLAAEKDFFRMAASKGERSARERDRVRRIRNKLRSVKRFLGIAEGEGEAYTLGVLIDRLEALSHLGACLREEVDLRHPLVLLAQCATECEEAARTCRPRRDASKKRGSPR